MYLKAMYSLVLVLLTTTGVAGTAAEANDKDGALGAFFSGVLATAVATPLLGLDHATIFALGERSGQRLTRSVLYGETADPSVIEARRLLPSRWDLLAAILVLGFLVAFVSALLVVQGLVRFVSRHGFGPFAWYRILAGAVILHFVR